MIGELPRYRIPSETIKAKHTVWSTSIPSINPTLSNLSRAILRSYTLSQHYPTVRERYLLEKTGLCECGLVSFRPLSRADY